MASPLVFAGIDLMAVDENSTKLLRFISCRQDISFKITNVDHMVVSEEKSWDQKSR